MITTWSAPDLCLMQDIVARMPTLSFIDPGTCWCFPRRTLDDAEARVARPAAASSPAASLQLFLGAIVHRQARHHSAGQEWFVAESVPLVGTRRMEERLSFSLPRLGSVAGSFAKEG